MAISKIAVTGATGRVGTHTVAALQEAGHEAVAIARSTGVDVVTGEGLDAALAGVDVVIDAATGNTSDKDDADAFFSASARNLQAAAERAGVRRIVLVSIIGVDRFAGGYQAAKAGQERALLAGPVPVRILRAAQFHEFVETIMQWGTQGDVVYMPEMQTQLVSARAVAEKLAELATGPGDGQTISEIAGPRVESSVAAARLLAARRGDGLRIEGVSDPSDPDHALYCGGGLLPGPGAALAGPTFEEWLDSALTLR